MAEIELPIKGSSPPEWAEYVIRNFAAFLQDHASCERKAAALAMSFVAKYPDRHALIEPMVALAREELEHFQQVYRLIRQNGMELAERDAKDPYVHDMMQSLRHGREERFLDRLLMSGLIEARGYERFRLLAEQLEDPDLKSFYKRLSESEAGHYKIFVRIARLYFTAGQVAEATERMAEAESQAMRKAPIRATLH